MQWWRNEFYSQFGEDAVLYGYFRSRQYAKTKQLDNIGAGYYIDIGAHHPFMISNTYFFYNLGWRGINVEPTPNAIKEFNTHRPEDTNLELAIAAENGSATLFDYGRDVKNTIIEADIDRKREFDAVEVETKTLVSLLDDYLPDGQYIDLMSIDVEGLDLVVCQSNDWEKYKPEVLVVEEHATRINEVLDSEIYKYLISKNYILYSWVKPSLIFRRNDL